MFSNSRTLYFILEGVTSLCFHIFLTVYPVYYASTVGMNPLQLVLVATVFEATIFLFEIPTGVIADIYSRRLSILLGLVFTAIALLVEGLFPVFTIILAVEILSGIGATLLSGATQAWITDEIGVEAANHAFIRAAQIRTSCAMVGIIISVALASIALQLPLIIAGIGLLALTGFLVIFMKETGFERTTRPTLTPVRDGFRLIRSRRFLLPIFIIIFVMAFHSEGFDNLWQKYLLDTFTFPRLATLKPVVWFGIIGLGANVLSLGLHEIIRRRVNLTDHIATGQLLMTICGLIVLGMLVFALIENFFMAILAYWLVAALRRVAEPITHAWLNQSFEPSIRATLFSMSGQTNAFGEIFGGPPIGAIGTVVSVRAALATCGLLLMAAFPFFVAVLRPQPMAQKELNNYIDGVQGTHSHPNTPDGLSH